MPGGEKDRAQQRWAAWIRLTFDPQRIGRFAGYCLRRFFSDDCPRSAASLSYASLLAMVPLAAIGLAILSGFPVFDAAREQIQDLIFRSFLPESSAAVSGHFSVFIENTRNLTGPGVLALLVTALLLLANIDRALNAIWRVTEPRPLGLQLLVYWAMLTLGPLLLGASVSLSGYAFAVVQWSGIGADTDGFVALTRLLSVVLATLGFALLYLVVPTRSVRIGHALAGGGLAAVVLEFLKYGFGLYLTHFPSYQAIYGALSTIPIFLIWMYLSWAVVLLGAEVTAALPEWRAVSARDRRTLNAGERLALSLSVLLRLRRAQRDGQQLRSRALRQGLPATPAEVDDTLQRLRRHGLALRSATGSWLLARDLAAVTLEDLCGLLGLGLELEGSWPDGPAHSVEGLAESSRAKLALPLEVLLEDPEVARRAERLEAV